MSVKVTYHGHSCVEISGSKRILIDPFLNGNPLAKINADYFDILDYIVVTHDHADHFGDTEKIAEKTGACIVAIHEISERCNKMGLKSEGMNIGGTIELEGIRFHMVNAVHSGDCTGFIIEIDGHTIYHSGDTALFSDMSLYGDFFNIDISFLPIGDRYTMGPKSAAKAVSLLKTDIVIPIHYGTFPMLTGTVAEFDEYVSDAKVIRLNIEESLEMEK